MTTGVGGWEGKKIKELKSQSTYWVIHMHTAGAKEVMLEEHRLPDLEVFNGWNKVDNNEGWEVVKSNGIKFKA